MSTHWPSYSKPSRKGRLTECLYPIDSILLNILKCLHICICFFVCLFYGHTMRDRMTFFSDLWLRPYCIDKYIFNICTQPTSNNKTYICVPKKCCYCSIIFVMGDFPNWMTFIWIPPKAHIYDPATKVVFSLRWTILLMSEYPSQIFMHSGVILLMVQSLPRDKCYAITENYFMSIGCYITTVGWI